jgi:hypothetical protein
LCRKTLLHQLVVLPDVRKDLILADQWRLSRNYNKKYISCRFFTVQLPRAGYFDWLSPPETAGHLQKSAG